MSDFVFKINGKVVSEEEFRAHGEPNTDFLKPRRLRAVQGCDTLPHAPSKSKRLIVSESSGVDPRDREEAMRQSVADGVPTYFDTEGRPHFEGERHQFRYLKTIGWHNHDGIH